MQPIMIKQESSILTRLLSCMLLLLLHVDQTDSTKLSASATLHLKMLFVYSALGRLIFGSRRQVLRVSPKPADF